MNIPPRVITAFLWIITMIYALNTKGQFYLDRGEYGEAMEYFTQSLTLSQETGDKDGARGNPCREIA